MRLDFFKSLAGASLLSLASGKQLAHIDVTPEDGEAHKCGTDCQNNINKGNIGDTKSVGQDFDFDFYATASNFSKSLGPGEILKFEAMDPTKLDIKTGTTIYRMQYTTKDLDNSTVPSTAFIAFPFTPHIPLPNEPEGSKYRLVAYAHGTVGLFQGCAPSNGEALYDFNTWKTLIDRGYAVVATDYAGLGNNYTTHKYIHHPTHANDIKYLVDAARKLFGTSFTDEWMSTGRSQGGGAVWKLAESKHVRNDPHYKGTVAIAPSTYIVDMIVNHLGDITANNKRDLEKRATQNTGYLTFLTTAVERAFPSYKANMLSETMKKRVELSIAHQLCTGAMLTIGTGLKALQLVDPLKFITELPTLKKFQAVTTPANGDKSPAPIMVIQGTKDTTIQPDTTEMAWKKSCDSGNEVHLRLYELMEHQPSQSASTPEFMGWMDAAFAGRLTCAQKCTKITRKPFDKVHVRITK